MICDSCEAARNNARLVFVGLMAFWLLPAGALFGVLLFGWGVAAFRSAVDIGILVTAGTVLIVALRMIILAWRAVVWRR